MPIKAILFDLDNTLIDFVKIKVYSIEKSADAMIKFGLKMKRKEVVDSLFKLYNKYGIEYQKIFQKFLKKHLNRIDYKLLAVAISAYRKAKALELKPYPNVLPTLKQLKKRFKIGVVSDAPRLQAWIRLADLGLVDIFDFMITFEDTGFKKPNPQPYRKALKILKLKPEQVLFVGDNPARDLKGAKAMGMKTCFAKYGFVAYLTPGYNPKEKIEADYTINDISELLKVVQAKNSHK